jgi:hypothetical protein
LGEVEAIKIHHLVPRSHKVMDERLLRVAACIDFRKGAELGVRTEDEIDSSADPFEFARRPIAPFKHVFRRGGLLPLGVHIEKIHKKIIGQRFGPFGEHALLGASEICVQGAQAADQNVFRRVIGTPDRLPKVTPLNLVIRAPYQGDIGYREG